ncbi:hypothetical protein BDN71DRAFT_358296 [Pleurotus eryngii]|uniref:Uncharacterized protein n=1 Tax=Pleurotus eryngii TaxID=5323 RepID=A0A9P6A3T2_PLEER|nr:hypothetical protein BDN71DRAFT_358296 [Pleurotus eryngii]
MGASSSELKPTITFFMYGSDMGPGCGGPCTLKTGRHTYIAEVLYLEHVDCAFAWVYAVYFILQLPYPSTVIILVTILGLPKSLQIRESNVTSDRLLQRYRQQQTCGCAPDGHLHFHQLMEELWCVDGQRQKRVAPKDGESEFDMLVIELRYWSALLRLTLCKGCFSDATFHSTTRDQAQITNGRTSA